MRTLILFIALLASFSARAEDDPRSYIGVSAGASDQLGVCAENHTPNSRTHCTGMLLRVFGGHNFNEHFGLEGAAVAAGTEGGFMELAAVGIAPVTEHFAFYGRVGAAFTDRASSGRALALAAGVRFHLGENFGLRFEWQRYSGDDSLELLSAGVFVRF